jgi:HSP20 family molecular chaperone IbpA
MPTAQATKQKAPAKPTLAILRVEDAACLLDDISSAILHRAFEIFERRGGEDGRDLDDWLAAEAELVCRTTVAVDDREDRMEVRIDLGDHDPHDVCLALTTHQLVLRAEARAIAHNSGGKWLLVRVNLPEAADLDTAKATVEGDSLLVVIDKQ